jgi:hypothetical protein
MVVKGHRVDKAVLTEADPTKRKLRFIEGGKCICNQLQRVGQRAKNR